VIYYHSPQPINFLCLRCAINSILSAPSASFYTGHVCTFIKAKEHISWSAILPHTSGKLAGSPGGEISYTSSLNSEQFLVQAAWMQAARDQSSDKSDLTSEQCGCRGATHPASAVGTQGHHSYLACCKQVTAFTSAGAKSGSVLVLSSLFVSLDLVRFSLCLSLFTSSEHSNHKTRPKASEDRDAYAAGVYWYAVSHHLSFQTESEGLVNLPLCSSWVSKAITVL